MRESVEGGIRAVVLREKDLPYPERFTVAEALIDILQPCGGTLIIASDVSLAEKLHIGWVHLAAPDPHFSQPGMQAGRSCHGRSELRQATEEEVAYVTLSPIFATPSKPGYGPEIGLNGLSRLAFATSLPVYALGGIGPGRVQACLQAGAYGVAVMGVVMGAKSPREVSAAVIAELTERACWVDNR